MAAAQATQTNDFLEKEGLGKLMRKFSIPCVVSLVVAALYNIVDQIFIANADYLGSFGNAANSVVYPLTVVALALTMMLGDGCCTFVSISLGAKEKDNARYGVGNAVVTIIAAGIVLMAVFLIFQEPILTIFGARVNEETFRLSKEYFFWISLGVPFYMFGQAMNPIVRSDGSPRFSMAVLLIGAVINIVLDPIFIYVCKWGMMGAALATILGQIVSALMFAGYLFKMKTVRLDLDSFKIRLPVMKKIIPFGATSFLSQFSIVLSMAAVLNMVTKYGALDPVFSQAEYAHIPTAVVGIVMKFFQIVVSIAVGISAGCISVAGYNLGAKRYDRVRRLMALLLKVEAVVGLIATIIFLLFPHQLTNIFGGRSESVYYVDFSVKCIRIFLCMVVLTCINKGTFIYMQALGDAKVSTALSMVREVIFGVGLPLLLPLFFGLDGVLYFMPLADILTFVASVIVVVRTNKKLRSAEEQGAVDESAAVMPAKGDPAARGVITIGRSYGAGGRSVGRAVAEALGIPYYDSELLEQAAVSSGLSRKFLESMDEKSVKPGAIYRYTGFASEQTAGLETIAARAQQEIIEKVAEEGSCVIVGRRADQILKGKKDLFRVFVMAPIPARAKRVAERENLSEQESAQKIKKADKERSAYYNQHLGQEWGAASTYDLCVDTEKLGVQGAAQLIVAAVQNLNH